MFYCGGLGLESRLRSSAAAVRKRSGTEKLLFTPSRRPGGGRDCPRMGGGEEEGDRKQTLGLWPICSGLTQENIASAGTNHTVRLAFGCLEAGPEERTEQGAGGSRSALQAQNFWCGTTPTRGIGCREPRGFGPSAGPPAPSTN